jgi:hypothetical protein
MRTIVLLYIFVFVLCLCDLFLFGLNIVAYKFVCKEHTRFYSSIGSGVRNVARNATSINVGSSCVQGHASCGRGKASQFYKHLLTLNLRARPRKLWAMPHLSARKFAANFNASAFKRDFGRGVQSSQLGGHGQLGPLMCLIRGTFATMTHRRIVANILAKPTDRCLPNLS